MTVTDDMVLTYDAARASAAALLDMMHDRATVLIDVVDYLAQWVDRGLAGPLMVDIGAMPKQDATGVVTILDRAINELLEVKAVANRRVATVENE